MSAARPKAIAAALLAALPAFWLAGYLGYVLFHPLASATTRQWAVDAAMLMAMEFLLVHAGFLSLLAMVQETLKTRAIIAGGLSAFYLLFMLIFWLVSGGSSVVIAGVFLLVSRMTSGVILGAEGVRQRGLVPIINVALYLVLCIATTVPERFPEFGFTANVMETIRPDFGNTSGVWVDMPQRPVLFGAIYFFIQGLISLTAVKNPRPVAADNSYPDERQRQSSIGAQGPARRSGRAR